RRHTRCYRDWSSDVCSSDLRSLQAPERVTCLSIRLDRCCRIHETYLVWHRSHEEPCRTRAIFLHPKCLLAIQRSYPSAFKFAPRSEERRVRKSTEHDRRRQL